MNFINWLISLNNSRKRKNKLVILKAISDLGNLAYGVTISRRLEVCGKKWSYGKVYHYINQLEESGLISTTMKHGLSSRGGKKARYCLLTEDGKWVLEADT